MTPDENTLRQEIEAYKQSLRELKVDLKTKDDHIDKLEALITFYEEEMEYARERLKQATERKGQ